MKRVYFIHASFDNGKSFDLWQRFGFTSFKKAKKEINDHLDYINKTRGYKIVPLISEKDIAYYYDESHEIFSPIIYYKIVKYNIY